MYGGLWDCSTNTLESSSVVISPGALNAPFLQLLHGGEGLEGRLALFMFRVTLEALTEMCKTGIHIYTGEVKMLYIQVLLMKTEVMLSLGR